jgi:beta-lactamase regulating signal transducer with metallopeptidase domain
MSALELAALQAWQQGVALAVAFTLATPAVALLRPRCRRAFGAERAFLLWLLPPLALLACLLPHPEHAPLVALPLVSADVAAALAPVHRSAASGADWRLWAVAA